MELERFVKCRNDHKRLKLVGIRERYLNVIFENQRLYHLFVKKRYLSQSDAKHLAVIYHKEELCSAAERSTLLKLVEQNMELFQASRNHVKLWMCKSDLVDKIRTRLVEQEGIQHYDADRYMQDYIMIMEKGAHIPLHRHPNVDDGMISVRYDVMIQRGKGTDGLPIADKIVHDVIEGGYYRYNAGASYFGTVEVKDDVNVIVLSFGFWIPLNTMYKCNIDGVKSAEIDCALYNLRKRLQNEESVNGRLKENLRIYDSNMLSKIVLSTISYNLVPIDYSLSCIISESDALDVSRHVRSLLLQSKSCELQQYNCICFNNIVLASVDAFYIDIHKRIVELISELSLPLSTLDAIEITLCHRGGCVQRAGVPDSKRYIFRIIVLDGGECVFLVGIKYYKICERNICITKECNDFGCTPIQGEKPLLMLQYIYK